MPRKNILEFLGKPIISYSIETAWESRLFERVVVSTEDEEIADVSRAWGADVAVRPESLAGDKAKVKDVCHHLLDAEEAEGRAYDILCCLYPTAPLRTAEDIRLTVELVEPGVCDFAMAVTEYGLPAHQAMRMDDSRLLVPLFPSIVTKQSQEVGSIYVDNGSTYAVFVPSFKRYGNFRGGGVRGHYMPRKRSVDIDTAEDLELALYYATRGKS